VGNPRCASASKNAQVEIAKVENAKVENAKVIIKIRTRVKELSNNILAL
jgi:hypothetical protein